MVAWLVAVGVLANQPGDVGLHASRRLDGRFKQVCQSREVPLVSTEDVALPRHIVHRGEEVLPTVGFCEIEVDFPRIEALDPGALAFGLDEARFRMNQILPRGSALGKPHGQIRPVVVGGIPRNARVVEGVFQGFGHAFMLVIRGDESQFGVSIQAQMHGIGRLHHGFECDFRVPSLDAPLLGIHDDRHTVVPDHAARVVCRQLPDGELSTVLIHPEHGVHHVAGSVGFNPSQQGVQGTVGVPEAEDAVVFTLALFELMHPQVGASVPAIDVACHVGDGGGMVQGRVKGRALVLGATFNLNAAQLVVPPRFTCRTVTVKIKSLDFGLQVLNGPFDVAKAQPHVHVEF